MGRRYIVRNGRQTSKAQAIAEDVLGKPLPAGVVVHHMDGNFENDAKDNLAILPSKAYHNLIHARMDAKAATGDPNKRRCNICKQYDDEENLYVRSKYGQSGWHRACHAAREIKRWRKANGRQAKN